MTDFRARASALVRTINRGDQSKVDDLIERELERDKADALMEGWA